MEIWILLAVAGSGYLAHCWQNLLKSKESFPDTSDVDDDDHSHSSNATLSSRRRFCHPSSSSRRLNAGSGQRWHVSKSPDSAGKMNVGYATHLHLPVGDDEERNGGQAYQNNDNLDTRSCSKIPMQSQTLPKAADPYPTNAKNSTNSPCKRPGVQTFNAFCAVNCCSFERCHQNREGQGVMSAEAFPENWYSAHCKQEFATDGSISMCLCDFEVKPTYNALDNDMVSEGAFLYDAMWMSRFGNVFEDTSVLEMSTSFIMQEREGRSSINTRKVRPHRKNGRNRCLTRRSRKLENHLPLTSSGNCPVQFDDTHSQEEIDDNIHFSSACEQSFNGLSDEHLGNELVETIVSDSCLSEENRGLLPSPTNKNSMVLNNKRKSESLVTEKVAGSTHLPSLPLRNNWRGRMKAWRECSAFPSGDSFLLQETANSLLKALLFNFGVGVGMMFTILSNKHDTKQLIGPLEETLCSLKDLEEEVHGRTKLMFECYQTKDTKEDAMAEQTNALVKVVRRITDVLEQVRNFLSQDLAYISAMDYKHSKERARLEAELEAELERMEMNLNSGEVSELCRRYPVVSEDVLKIGNLVQGELSTRGLPCDAEANSVSNDGGDSCYEVIHYNNFAVPPMELANRLREVLEARQAREILELEAKIKHLDARLQAKQEELQVWKQRATHLLQGSICESFSSFQEKGVYVKAVETTKNVCRAEEPCRFCVGMHDWTFGSSLSLGCNEQITSNFTNEFCSSHLNASQPTTCLDDEADNENFEEISQHLSDTATGSPTSALPNGLFKGAHSKDSESRGNLMSHQELELPGFSNDVTDYTLDSSPCSIKFVDRHTILHDHLEDKLEHKAGMEAGSRKKCLNLEQKAYCGAVCLTQVNPADCAQDVIEISESNAQFRDTLDWSTSEDASYSSDLDEKFGRLLIKRIVEKSKRGSSIVEVAQNVMASFEIDETSSVTELSGVI